MIEEYIIHLLSGTIGALIAWIVIGSRDIGKLRKRVNDLEVSMFYTETYLASLLIRLGLPQDELPPRMQLKHLKKDNENDD